ncbi:JmjC domain-containing histone demethylation protein 1 [Orbilia oligospora]|nr:JmjC domain-containing histone demethylation protein 1 [Orbilia oligospora]KAF3266242.1 JmjC domain-containing histone demethylation protein 1 [Orbilia oligospora]KAF3268639.1 JmjC domain-containing histone demethylation protein 1 [Orbilia oligospora]
MSSNTRSKKTERTTRTSERNRKSLGASGSEKAPSRSSGRRKEHTPDKVSSSDSRDESGIGLVESLLGDEVADTPVDAEALGQKLFEQLSKAMKKPHTPAPEPEDASPSESTPKLKIEDDSEQSEAGLPTPKPVDDKIRAEDLEAARDLVHFFEAPRYLSEKPDGDGAVETNGDAAIVTTSIDVTTQDASELDALSPMKVTATVTAANTTTTPGPLNDSMLSDSSPGPEMQFTISTIASLEPGQPIVKRASVSKVTGPSPKPATPILITDDVGGNRVSSVETPKHVGRSTSIDDVKLERQEAPRDTTASDVTDPMALDEMDVSKSSAMEDLLAPVTSSMGIDSMTDTAFATHEEPSGFLDMSSKAGDIFNSDLPLLSGGINPLDISLNMDVEDVTMADTSDSKRESNLAEDEDTPIDSCAFCRRAVPLVRTGPRSHIVPTLWIQCDGCKKWYHNVCVNVSEKEVNDLDKYHCSDCVPRLGASTYRRKSSRAHTAIDYVSLNEGSRAPFKAPGDSTQHPFVEPINHMQFAPDDFPRMIPELLDVDFFEQGQGFTQPIVIPASNNPRPHCLREIHLLTNGLREDGSIDVEKVSKVEKFPALFKKDKKDATPKSRSAIRVATSDQVTVARRPTDDADALGMVMPADLTVRRVADIIGTEEKVEVLDVLSQSLDKRTWSFADWVEYFESPLKDRVKNVISQEFSHTKLAEAVVRPAIVEALDLADQVWPEDMRSTFPKVQLYCLMGVSGSYTDFHIDFGGSSVFYHVISGKKTFFFVPPTKYNLTKYETWSQLPDQNSTWYPSLLTNGNGNGEDIVRRVDLQAGDTMLIPSGWIHAVLTPEDALVIGGNFLTRLSLDQQIRIAEIEKNTEVPAKFRYPQFQKVMWFTALDYLQKDPLPEELFDDDDWDLLIATEDVQIQRTYVGYSQYELDGLPVLGDYLLRTALIVMNYITEGITQDKRKRVQNSIPKHVQDPLSTVQLFGRWMAWKRGDIVVPYWARRNWNPGEGFSGLGGSGGRSGPKKKKSESADIGKGGSPREGLRKSKPSAKLRDSLPGSPSIVVTPSRQVSFSSDPKAAADKIKSFAKKIGKRQMSPTSAAAGGTPTAPKARKISAGSSSQSTPGSSQKRQGSDTPGPARPRSGSGARRQSISQNGASKPALVYTPDGKPLSQAVINKGLADNHRLAETIRNKYAYSSSPKNSILGPKRTACDECRRQKIACKHKDEVALAEAEIMKELVKGPKSGGAFETPTKPAQGSPKTQPVVPGSNKDSARGVNYQISKNGRPVACEACKRSRRRCIHNGQEGFPPAKRRSQKDKGTPETDGANDAKPRRKKIPTSAGMDGVADYDSMHEFSDELSTLSSLDSETLQDEDPAQLDQILLGAGPKGAGKGFLGSSPGDGKKYLNMNFGGSTSGFNSYSQEGGLRTGVPTVGNGSSGDSDGNGISQDDSRAGTKRRLPEEFAGFRGSADDGDDADASVFAATAAVAAAGTAANTGSPTKRARVDASTPLFSPPEEGVYEEYFTGAGDDDKKKDGVDKEWESNDLPTMFIPPAGIPPGA